ncbi:Ribonuclease D [Clarias magur]|uniref:Ribonuclease D n=1 Tax=Clarias magur TaxID=1594786 RepID=A0A8J4WRI9_CLAMG|nr:Ribonuclease D [Clarias magur]
MFRPISEEQNPLDLVSEVKTHWTFRPISEEQNCRILHALGSGSEVKDALDVQAYFGGAECLSPSCPWIWFRGERRTGRSGLFLRSRMSESLVPLDLVQR